MRPELHFAVQIDTTLHRSESPVIHGFQRFALSFNRTVVKLDHTLIRLVVNLNTYFPVTTNTVSRVFLSFPLPNIFHVAE